MKLIAGFLFFSLISSTLYSAKDAPLEDRLFDPTCPKGEGAYYCSKTFNQRLKLYFPSYAQEVEDEIMKYFFEPDIKFFDQRGKVVFHYNQSGVIYKGKKVCEVEKLTARPYVKENSPCPLFIDGPIRYVLNARSEVAGAVVLFDQYEKGVGKTYFNNETLIYKESESARHYDDNPVVESRALFNKSVELNPGLKEAINSFSTLLEKSGYRGLIDNKSVFYDTPRTFGGVYEGSEVFKNNYSSSPLLQQLFKKCINEELRVETTVQQLKSASLKIASPRYYFELKGIVRRPLILQCHYDQEVESKRWKLTIRLTTSTSKAADYDQPAYWLY